MQHDSLGYLRMLGFQILKTQEFYKFENKLNFLEKGPKRNVFITVLDCAYACTHKF